MKSKYAGLWWLLAVALIVVVVVSFADDITLGSWKVKKAPFREMILAEELGADAMAAEGDLETDPLGHTGGGVGKPHIEPTDSTPQTFLLIGDSMTLNLALRLAEYAKQNGHTMHAVNWDSSNTKIWAESDTLDYFIREYQPTYVFVSLGSNELYLKHPESRKPYVEKILDKIGDRPYVWIGPPNWKEDFGINDMIEKACRPRSFFRSAGMEFERKKDHIHPTRKASALWIDSIMRWIPKSSHPILADAPSDTIGKAKTHVIYLKALNK